MIKEYKKTKRQERFENERQNYSDRDILIELLYTNWLIYQNTEKNRSNTSVIVWIIVVSVLLSFILYNLKF